MKILLLNQNWFFRELTAEGHEVVTAGWAHAAFDVKFERLISLDELVQTLPTDFHPDVIIYFDDSYSASIVGLEDCVCPLIFCSIDTHHHLAWHSWFGNLFDCTLVCQKDYLGRFRPNYLGTEAQLRWFPLWAPVTPNPAPERDIPVSFRGTLDPDLHPVRAAFFAALSRLVPLDACGGPYTEVYPRSKIVINQSVSLDLNFRVFESMMAGALLITPRIGNGLLELFQDGAHLRVYEAENVAEAANLIRYYLENDSEREKIAAAGHAEVDRLHDSSARAKELESIALALRSSPKPRRYFSAAITYLHAFSMYRNMEEGIVSLSGDRQKLLQALKHNLLRSAEAGEGIDEDFRAASLLCKCFLEIAVSQEEVLAFTTEISAAAPGDLLLRLSYVEDLLVSGRHEEAAQIARNLSASPEEFLGSLPKVMQAAKTQVLEGLRRS